MNPERRRIYEKFRGEVNRQLDPDTPATARWVTAGGIVLSVVALANLAVQLPRFVLWPAYIGLIVLWMVDEFSAYQAWRLYEQAQLRGANQVALKAQRDALVRECFGRSYLLVVYWSTVKAFNSTTNWFLNLIAGAGSLYICWLILAFVRTEAQMRGRQRELVLPREVPLQLFD